MAMEGVLNVNGNTELPIDVFLLFVFLACQHNLGYNFYGVGTGKMILANLGVKTTSTARLLQ
jgi:hypothetical protein